MVLFVRHGTFVPYDRLRVVLDSPAEQGPAAALVVAHFSH
jgi:hypothetical protein